ncbi:hypothetical protein [Serratia sp. UGAL515B_01]|uniref:hypothetical protein n=1 Tax=Serratia sp. UGAL515B_01 TaxID=2986763 RepID=UPI0029547DC9|nr:hypothetical protein [Serratia sp. UGAL515B_01]WON77536.1 hypothetical protein OK023_02185 [Serratia sp. UGAL515B_01]
MSKQFEELKAAALAIGHERWVQDGSSVNTENYMIANGEMCCDHIGCFESVNGESPHAKYVAAASPAVVLELLAALAQEERAELAEQCCKELEESLGVANSATQVWRERAEAAEKSLTASREVVSLYDGKLNEAERRIAELEQRLQQPIKIKQYDEFAICHITGASDDYCKGWIDGRNSATNDAKKAGFTVEGE